MLKKRIYQYIIILIFTHSPIEVMWLSARLSSVRFSSVLKPCLTHTHMHFTNIVLILPACWWQGAGLNQVDRISSHPHLDLRDEVVVEPEDTQVDQRLQVTHLPDLIVIEEESLQLHTLLQTWDLLIYIKNHASVCQWDFCISGVDSFPLTAGLISISDMVVMARAPSLTVSWHSATQSSRSSGQSSRPWILQTFCPTMVSVSSPGNRESPSMRGNPEKNIWRASTPRPSSHIFS